MGDQAIDSKLQTFLAARLSALVLACAGVGPLWALGLGDIEVESHLNEPLAASIRIIGSSQGEISVRLGDRDAYERLGLSRPRQLERVQVFVAPADTGQVVRIAGQTPVSELILDLVLILADADSSQTRHYAILLDFPSAAPEPVVRTDPPRPARAPVPDAAQRPAPPRTGVVSTGKTYGPVQPGQTLGGIARQLRGDQPVRYWALVEALFELNPDAFIGNDIDRLKVGAVLQIPSMEGLAATTVNRAPAVAAAPAVVREAPPRTRNELQPDPTRRAADPRHDPHLEIIGTPNSAEILNSMNRMLEQDDAELAARGQEARRQLAFATAEIQTYRNENERLREQVSELEQRVADLNRLIELRAAEARGAAPGAAAPAEEPAAARPIATAEPAPAPAVPRADPEALVSVPGEGVPRGVERTAPEPRPWYLSWLPWLLALVVVIIAGVLVWLRTQREHQRRQERTADLVNRIRQAADRA